MAAIDLPVASIVACPGLDGLFLKEDRGRWIYCAPSGARTAYDPEVDEALADGATVLRDGAR